MSNYKKPTSVPVDSDVRTFRDEFIQTGGILRKNTEVGIDGSDEDIAAVSGTLQGQIEDLQTQIDNAVISGGGVSESYVDAADEALQDNIDLKADISYVNFQDAATVTSGNNALLSASGTLQTQLDDRVVVNLKNKNVIYVSRGPVNDTGATGAIDKPFRTVQGAITFIKQTAIDEASIQPSCGSTIIIFPGEYTEDVTVNMDSAYPVGVLDIMGLPTTIDSQPTKITGQFVISGTQTTRIRFRDIQLSTRQAISGGTNTDVALTISGTQGRMYFENTTVTKAITTNPATPTILFTGAYTRWADFTRCNWNGPFVLTGSPTGNPTILVSQNNNFDGTIDIQHDSYTVRVHDCQRTGFITHSAGKLLLHNIAEIKPDSSNNAIISTANTSSNAFLSLVDVNLYGTTINAGNFSKINKTGNCNYHLGFVNRDQSIDVLSGDRGNFAGTADDINAGFSPSNYDVETQSITSHLAGIDEALLTAGGGLPVKLDKIFHISISGSDDTGDGSLNAPFATVQKVQSILPNNLDIDNSVGIMFGVGEYDLNGTLELNPGIHLIGMGIGITKLDGGDIVLNTTSGNFDIDGPQSVGLHNLSIPEYEVYFDTSSQAVNGSSALKVYLDNISVDDSAVEVVGRPSLYDQVSIRNIVTDNDINLYNLRGSAINTTCGDDFRIYSDNAVGAVEFNISNCYINDHLQVQTNSQAMQVTVYSTRLENLELVGEVYLTIDAVSLPSDESDIDTSSLTGSISKTTEAYSIRVEHTADNYTPESNDVGGHLIGIDQKLEPLTGLNNKLSFYGGSGTLTSIDQLGVTPEGGLNLYINETTFTGSDVQSGRNLHHRTWHERPTQDILLDYTNFYHTNVEFDPENSGFDYGAGDDMSNYGGMGIRSTYFRHRGDGHLNRFDLQNDALQFGDNGTSGTLLQAFGTTQYANINENFNLHFFRSHFLGFNVYSGGTLEQYAGLEHNNQVNPGGTLSGNNSYYTGNRFNLTNNSGTVAGYAEQMNIGFSGDEYGQWGYLTLLNMNMNVPTAVRGATGININFNNDISVIDSNQGNLMGISINMGNYDTTQQRRAALSTNNGTNSFVNQLQTLSNMQFDQGNLFATMFQVPSGSPITGTEFIANNFPMMLMFADNFDVGPLGLGVVGVGFVGQIMATNSGAVVDTFHCSLGGMSVPFESTGGTIDNFNVFSAMGVLSFGGAVTIDNLRAFYMRGGSMGTNKWGTYIEDETADNWFAKSVIIGNGDDVPTNSDIALEITNKKAMKFTPMTLAERDALVPADGMLVYINEVGSCAFSYYDGGTSTWKVLVGA